MTGRLRTYFDLVRIPNVLTAAADSLAGFLFVGGSLSDYPSAVLLMGASCCLYAGGVALNDVCDVARDAVDRPRRPIPSGRVSRQNAGTISAALLAIGVLLASTQSLETGLVSLALVVAILLYNAVLKRTVIAPAMMGLCRALNLALGMSIAPDLALATVLPPIVLMWLYIASVTLFARTEATGGRRIQLGAGAAGVGLAVAGLVALPSVVPQGRWEGSWLAALLLAVLGYYGCRAIKLAEPVAVQRAVVVAVLSVVVVDTCIAASTCGLWPAMAVGAILLPVLLLGRLYRVT